MAIDRQAIIDAIFNGTRMPAQSTSCRRSSPATARAPAAQPASTTPRPRPALFEEAGGFEGTLTLWFNTGAGHDLWMEAVGQPAAAEPRASAYEFEEQQFADYLGRLDAQEVTGPFRLGWVMDYP